MFLMLFILISILTAKFFDKKFYNMIERRIIEKTKTFTEKI
jgi:hypothetical protein